MKRKSTKTFAEERDSFRDIPRIFWESPHAYPTQPFEGILSEREDQSRPLSNSDAADPAFQKERQYVAPGGFHERDSCSSTVPVMLIRFRESPGTRRRRTHNSRTRSGTCSGAMNCSITTSSFLLLDWNRHCYRSGARRMADRAGLVELGVFY